MQDNHLYSKGNLWNGESGFVQIQAYVPSFRTRPAPFPQARPRRFQFLSTGHLARTTADRARGLHSVPTSVGQAGDPGQFTVMRAPLQ